MGIAFGDTDGNGLPDIMITHFLGEHLIPYRARLLLDGRAGSALETKPTKLV